MYDEKMRDRFLSRVEKTSSCWLWVAEQYGVDPSTISMAISGRNWGGVQ